MRNFYSIIYIFIFIFIFFYAYFVLDYSGDVLKAIDYMPSLAKYSFNNRIEACCVTGIWILYAEENFNGR